MLASITQIIAEKVISYILDQSQGRTETWVCEKMDLKSMQQAFQHALYRAFERFEEQYPEWAASLFDASFFERDAVPILAQFLLRNGHPDPSDLARHWAYFLNIRRSEHRTILIRELEPAAADFLASLTQELMSEPELEDLNDGQALERLVGTLDALRHKLSTEQTTPGTRWDYFRWLIESNLYLDLKGTLQTQRQQVKLDEVYISLRAQRDDTIDAADRRLLEHELDKLEAQNASNNLLAEEVEDQREQLLARFKSSSSSALGGQAGGTLELADAVSRYDHLVILGDPGSGKTTLLRYLALKHAQALLNGQTEASADLGPARFPILIRIADYAEGEVWREKSVGDFLIDYYRHEYHPSTGIADLLAWELAAGRCLILLDGLDEVVSAYNRRGVVQQIEDFVHRYDSVSNRFVITSRIAGYNSAPLGEVFAHYTVQDMNEQQIRHFLEHWCTAVEAAQTPDLPLEARETKARREIDGIMKAAHASSGVRRLAANPLLLRILALIHRTGAQLPQKRIELYKLAADTLARTWQTAQGMPESTLVEDEYLTRLLSWLAYWLHVNKPTGILTEGEVLAALDEEWTRIKGLSWDEESLDIESEVKNFLRAVREHTGLFVERAPRRYGFMHLTFEEYFAARYLVARSKTREKLIRRHLHDPRWDEPILLALGFVGLDAPDDAIELLETAILAQGEEAKRLHFHPSPYEDLLGQDYLFALRCLGDQIPANSRFVRTLIKRLANELLHTTGSARFQRYRQALRERLVYLSGSKAASMLLPVLIAALSDAEPEVRRVAAESLGQLGQTSEEAIEALLIALHDADLSVRYQAVQSLGQVGQASEEVIEALLHSLANDFPRVRRVAAASLGQLGRASGKVIGALLTALHDDLGVCYQAAESLGQLGQVSGEVVAALLTTLVDADPVVRRAVVQSLGQLSQASQEVIEALFRALQDADPDVRRETVQSLVPLQRRRVASEVVAVLLKALQDADTGVRRAVVQSLGQLSQASQEVIEALLHSLAHDVAWVRRAAAESLGRLGQASDQVVLALLYTLHDNDSDSRYAAAESLGRLGQASDQVVQALLFTLHDSKVEVRRAAAESLSRLGQASDQVVQALLYTLHDSQRQVRRLAAESLGHLRYASSEVVNALHYALEDNDLNVRYRAAQSLGQVVGATSEIVTILLEALHNAKDWLIRCNSARLLGQIGSSDDPTVQTLMRGLLDIDHHVRSTSAQALAQLGHHSPDAAKVIAKELLQAIEDPEFDKPDTSLEKRSAHDYAFDGLWLLVAGNVIDEV